MREKIVYKSEKTGTPPGTLVYIGEERKEEVSISKFLYSDKFVEEEVILDPENITVPRSENIKYWVDVDGIHNKEVIEKVGKIFDIHPLTLEDIMNSEHRPKLEYHEDYIFIILKMLTYNEEKEEIESEQVSMVFGDDFLVSFQEKTGDVFGPVRKLIREKNSNRIKKEGSDYLAYALLDSIIDNYYYILEKTGERIEILEDELISGYDSDIMNKIHELKKTMTIFRRSAWPLREIMSGFLKNESSIIREQTIPFIRDLYDHVVQIIETIEISRDNLSNLIDLYLSNSSAKMNETMKVLTIIATIFIPLTFIVGVYGMNFEYMPELTWRAGYPLIMGIMLILSLLMLYYFKKKKWL